MKKDSENIAVKHTDINMEERIKTVEKETANSTPYLHSCIRPQLAKVTFNPNELWRLGKCAECSFLLHTTGIQNYTVIRHDHIKNWGELFTFAEIKDSLHGCLVYSDGLAQYITWDKEVLQEDLLENSIYVGKTLAEITKEFDIPHAEQIPSRYVPYPHFEIEQIIKNSDGYVNDFIMPKFTGISEDSDKWWRLYDFCHGSILVKASVVLNFTVIEHYQDKEETDYFVVQNDYGILHYFALYHGICCDFIRYGNVFGEDLIQCGNSPYIGKKLREIVKTYDIPFLFEIPEIFNRLDNISNYLP